MQVKKFHSLKTSLEKRCNCKAQHTFRINVSVTASHNAICAASLFLERSISRFVAEGERSIVVDLVVVANGLHWRSFSGLGVFGAWAESVNLRSPRQWSDGGDCSWSVVARSLGLSLSLIAVDALIFFFVHIHQLLRVVLLGLRPIILKDWPLLLAGFLFGALDLLNRTRTKADPPSLCFAADGEKNQKSERNLKLLRNVEN